MTLFFVIFGGILKGMLLEMIFTFISSTLKIAPLKRQKNSKYFFSDYAKWLSTMVYDSAESNMNLHNHREIA